MLGVFQQLYAQYHFWSKLDERTTQIASQFSYMVASLTLTELQEMIAWFEKTLVCVRSWQLTIIVVAYYWQSFLAVVAYDWARNCLQMAPHAHYNAFTTTNTVHLTHDRYRRNQFIFEPITKYAMSQKWSRPLNYWHWNLNVCWKSKMMNDHSQQAKHGGWNYPSPTLLIFRGGEGRGGEGPRRVLPSGDHDLWL